jgi:hypothetical protein
MWQVTRHDRTIHRLGCDTLQIAVQLSVIQEQTTIKLHEMGKKCAEISRGKVTRCFVLKCLYNTIRHISAVIFRTTSMLEVWFLFFFSVLSFKRLLQRNYLNNIYRKYEHSTIHLTFREDREFIFWFVTILILKSSHQLCLFYHIKCKDIHRAEQDAVGQQQTLTWSRNCSLFKECDIWLAHSNCKLRWDIEIQPTISRPLSSRLIFKALLYIWF